MNTLSLFLLILSLANTDNLCQCLNQGVCSQFNRCRCPPTYIGQKCQIYAQSLKQQASEFTLSANQTYFYFQPTQTNYYRLTFNICMLYNPSHLPSLFYIQTQKINGAIGTVRSLFQTAKIVLGEKGCVSFTTNYISIKRKEDQSYRKIVVRLTTLEKDDPSHYLNVYRSQLQNSNQIQIKELPNILLPVGFNYQKVTIKMKYQKYMQASSYGKFIIVFTASLLLLVFSAFIKYVRKKYRVQIQDRVTQFQQFDISRYRYQSRNNPQLQARRRKNKAECIQIFMPVTRYGEKSCFFVLQSLSNCEEILQNDAEECCSICLNYFSKQEEIRTTPCKHHYHRQCIDNWCESNLSCPICRYPLDFRRQIKKIYMSMVSKETVR